MGYLPSRRSYRSTRRTKTWCGRFQSRSLPVRACQSRSRRGPEKGTVGLRFMSNPKIRALVDSTEPNPGATTTLVRADDSLNGEDSPDLHPQLRAQLKEVRLRTESPTPDLSILLQLVSAHYQAIDEER